MANGHVLFAWAWILAGLIAGAGQGLCFHREDFWGGYGSWRRRLTRLGHVSFFGTAAINLAFGLTWPSIVADASAAVYGLASPLLIAGALTMPAVCYLAAWRQSVRHLFFVPVTCLIVGVLLVAAAGFQSFMGNPS